MKLHEILYRVKKYGDQVYFDFTIVRKKTVILTIIYVVCNLDTNLREMFIESFTDFNSERNTGVIINDNLIYEICSINMRTEVITKVLSSPTHTLIPTEFSLLETVLVRFFCDGFQLLRRICFNLRNRLKSSSFQGFFKFWEQEKVTRSNVGWVGKVGKNSDWPKVFGQKLTSSEC